MLLMVLNLTLGMVIITSTKCPHLHLLVQRYRQAFWCEVGEVSRKCCFMHQRRDRRRKTTTTKPRNPGKLALSAEISQHGESVILVQQICVFDQACSQDVCILTTLFFVSASVHVFFLMDREEVQVNKNAKRKEARIQPSWGHPWCKNL